MNTEILAGDVLAVLRGFRIGLYIAGIVILITSIPDILGFFFPGRTKSERKRG